MFGLIFHETICRFETFFRQKTGSVVKCSKVGHGLSSRTYYRQICVYKGRLIHQGLRAFGRTAQVQRNQQKESSKFRGKSLEVTSCWPLFNHSLCQLIDESVKTFQI